MNQNWLTMSEAIAYLKVKSDTTVRNIVRMYGIRQSKLLSITYYSREDIDRVWEERGAAWQPE